MTGIVRSFSKTNCECRDPSCQIIVRGHWQCRAFLPLKCSQLLADPPVYLYVCLARSRRLETKYCSTSPWSKGRKNALYFGLGNWHLRTSLPKRVHGTSDSNSVLLALFAGFIVGPHYDRRANELPELDAVLLLSGPSSLSLLHSPDPLPQP